MEILSDVAEVNSNGRNTVRVILDDVEVAYINQIIRKEEEHGVEADELVVFTRLKDGIKQAKNIVRPS